MEDKSPAQFIQSRNTMKGANKKPGASLQFAFLDSRFGAVCCVFSQEGLCGLFPGNARADSLAEARRHFSSAQIIELEESAFHARDELQRTLDNPRYRSEVSLDLRGTEFQRRVWDLICGIPAGRTASYGEIAGMLGMATAARAVARACASNPVAFLVPCHRVVGERGDLRGYRWGLERKKQRLLEEGCQLLAARAPF
jgi:AraC family transcriptional regulator of adaptative response/methylated-DNA-[protein]-cysteine methyltransferase